MYTSDLKKTPRILVIYATTSGNSQLVAEAVCDGINQTGGLSTIQKAELSTPDQINNYDAAVLVASTWNVGLLNDNMIKFHEDMLKMQFPGKIIEVIGLGDSRGYDIFCGSADILEKAVAQVGARQIMYTLRIDGSVYHRLEEFKGWGKVFIDKLNKEFSTENI